MWPGFQPTRLFTPNAIGLAAVNGYDVPCPAYTACLPRYNRTSDAMA